MSGAQPSGGPGRFAAPAGKPGFARPFTGPGTGRRQNLPALLALLLCVAILLAGTVAIFLPFAAPIVLALVLMTAAYPVFNWILRWIGEQRRGLASAFTCALIVLAVFVPLAWITYSIVSGAPSKDELNRARDSFTNWLHENETIKEVSSWLESLGKRLSETADALKVDAAAGSPKADGATDSLKVDATAGSPKVDAAADSPKVVGAADSQLPTVKTAVAWAASNLRAILTSIVSNTALILLNFFLMLLILFFFLKDGPIILQAVMRQIPLEKGYQEKVVSTFVQVSRSVIRGSFGTAFFQGAIASAAYAVVGVSAIFWGVVTAFSALIPVVGTTIVTVPLAVYLYFKASLWKCVVVAVMAVAIGTLDNFLKPMLMRGTLRVHSIWLILSILGGVSAFGPMGLLYGPMVLTLLGTFLALFVREEEAEAAREEGGSRAATGSQRPDTPPAQTTAGRTANVPRAAADVPGVAGAPP